MGSRTSCKSDNNATTKLRNRKGRGDIEMDAETSRNGRTGDSHDTGLAVSGAAAVSPSWSSMLLSSSPGSSSPEGLYGDMLGCCNGFVVIPDLGWKVYKVMTQTDPAHPKRTVAPWLYLWWVGVIFAHFGLQYLNWHSKRTRNPKTQKHHRQHDNHRVGVGDVNKNDTNNVRFRLFLSRLIFFGCTLGCSFMDIVDWPYTGEATNTSLSQIGVCIGVVANVSLSFREKMIRLAFLSAVGSAVSLWSPYSVYTEDTLPVLGGTVLLAAFGLYCFEHKIARGLATVLFARWILAAVFFHHTVGLLTAIHPSGEGEGLSARDNFTAVFRASVIACIGIVATGTCREEIWQREQLEILIADRTRELRVRHEELGMVNRALQATDTAIAITNEHGRIVWCNDAFERLGSNRSVFERRGGGTLLGCSLNHVIYNIDPTQKTNKYKLLDALDDIHGGDKRNGDGEYSNNGDSDAFLVKQRRKDEIKLGSSVFQLEATPFLHSGSGSGNDAAPVASAKRDRRVLVVFKDITEMRARERAEKKARDEATMARAMGESMVTLTHELRTPLQGIMGITSLLLQSGGGDGETDDGSNHAGISAEALESLKLIMASSSLLLNLINNLLDVKKAASKMLGEFPLASLPASGPIKDSVVFCRPLASISRVELLVDTSSAPDACVRSNSLRLQQVLINLVSNAIKYTDRGSTITIRTRVSTEAEVRSNLETALASSSPAVGSEEVTTAGDAAVLVFSVSDNGPGITPDQAHRLFRRFAQLDTQPTRNLGGGTVGQPSGTGLGLHLCELFVRRMHGHIWATNNSNKGGGVGEEGGRGSTFSFSLPLSTNTSLRRRNSFRRNIGGLAHDPVSSEVSSHPEDSSRNHDRLRVLLVDDTLINRKVISRILRRVGFTNVTCVDSGSAALKELSSAVGNGYDLVMTDLQMPEMSGTELTEAIFDSRADGFRRRHPPPIVIGITAETGFDVAGRCRASGMSDVLYKPITVEDMRDFANTRIPLLQPSVWCGDEDVTMPLVVEHASQR